jgi:glutathione synthase/RimK-type ligase-like ATP-grasp enzyme
MSNFADKADLMNSILVISHLQDAHAVEVLRCLTAQGAEAILFDTSRIPRDMRLTIEYGLESAWSGRGTLDGKQLDFGAVRSVWWRRPQPFGLHAQIDGSDDRTFAFAETHAAVSGLWSLLDAGWVNDPERDERASRKAWQLRLAQEAGLTIPRTCITNDPSVARSFVANSPESIIYKAFQGTEQAWRETRILKREEQSQLDAVQYAPVIFQEYIKARVDLRVTIVGEAIFAAEIHSQSSAYPHDFRMDMANVKIAPHELPVSVMTQLLSLMRRLGLVYGAIDLRQTPEGKYVFLEINPAGQWLFVEQQTGQPISATLAASLIALAANIHASS